MSYLERLKPLFTMLAVNLGLSIVNILFKRALEEGMNALVAVVYRQVIAAVLLIPFAYVWERESWNKLTARVIGQIFLCALFGLTLTQYLFMVGLYYTTATFTTGFLNIVPVLTFLIALSLRMEKLNIKSKSGKAKVLGSLTCVGGLLTLTLYKGMPLINARRHVLMNKSPPPSPKSYGLGSAFLVTACSLWASWFLIQNRIGQHFPYRYSSTSMMSFFGAVQSVMLCLVINDDRRNLAKIWGLKGALQILSVVYAGVVGSGLCYVVMSWCVKVKGPVFTSAFSPFLQIFTAIFDVLALHEEINMGSVLGSVIVVVGMYLLLWGKSNDEEATTCNKSDVNTKELVDGLDGACQEPAQEITSRRDNNIHDHV